MVWVGLGWGVVVVGRRTHRARKPDIELISNRYDTRRLRLTREGLLPQRFEHGRTSECPVHTADECFALCYGTICSATTRHTFSWPLEGGLDTDHSLLATAATLGTTTAWRWTGIGGTPMDTVCAPFSDARKGEDGRAVLAFLRVCRNETPWTRQRFGGVVGAHPKLNPNCRHKIAEDMALNCVIV